MALVIDATEGGANSNSYITLADANTYFDARLYSDTWINAASDDIRNRALVMATKRIDQEDFYGDRATTTQKLKFPRVNLGYLDGILLDNTIPDQVIEATCELAIYLLKVDMTRNGTNAGTIKDVKLGSLSVGYQVDYQDNNSKGFNSLPPFVANLLQDLSGTSSSVMIDISR